jgi:hypothetical protein
VALRGAAKGVGLLTAEVDPGPETNYLGVHLNRAHCDRNAHVPEAGRCNHGLRQG